MASDRVMAINVLKVQMAVHEELGNRGEVEALDMAIEALKELPSAQPEIIRCKDCKYWMPHSQLGYDEDNETYHDYCEKLIPEDEYYAFYRDADDYCSRAERRTDDNTD